MGGGGRPPIGGALRMRDSRLTLSVNSAESSRESLLTSTFVELADTLVDEFDIVELLTMLAGRCVQVLDVAAAGLMLVAPERELRVVASSSEAMRRVELFELHAQEGPALDCYRTRKPVLNQHLGEVNRRWPRFEAFALDAGFRSVHALPMRLRGEVIGALDLFGTDRAEMLEANTVAGQAFADVAAISVTQHRALLKVQAVNGQLRHALQSRILIEQAKGIVAERAGATIEEAFARMRNYARNHNLKLVDVAGTIIDGTFKADLS
jgi:GAF domain-containing protein